MRRNATMSSCRNANPRRRTATLLLVSSAVFLSGCAHSNPPASPTPAQEPAAMTVPATPTDNPTLTAEEIGRRFLKLIERSEEHTSELQSLMRISYAVFCLKKKKTHTILTKSLITSYQQCKHTILRHTGVHT